MSIYPWDDWIARDRVRLRRGVHYDCMSHCMAIQVRQAARARGRRASIATLQKRKREWLEVVLEDA